MMPDASIHERDPQHAYRTLLRILSGCPVDEVVSSDSFRDDTEAAQLTSAEKSGALTRAMNVGYLQALVAHDHRGVPYVHHGQRVLGCVSSNREFGKGGRVLLYTRTDVPVPEHVCQEHVSSAMRDVSIENERLAEVSADDQIEGQTDIFAALSGGAA